MLFPQAKVGILFQSERIHMFNYKDYCFEKSIENVITSNDVYILGAKVVAHKKLWTDLDELMQLSYVRH